MSCAGLITMNYKFAVARSLVEDLLPRVGDDSETARHHMQRALNALTAPGARATGEQKQAAENGGYHEIAGVLGNPVHGMPDEEGLGILPHLQKLGESHAHARGAVEIVTLARKYAAHALQLEDAGAIKRMGRVVTYLLRAAHEAIN